jgi:Zn-dependent protease
MLLALLFSDPLSFAIVASALVFSLSAHEAAHAWTADHLGDPTARLQGRITLNPLAHLDPLGTVLMLVAGFGWGKPVQFDPYNLQHPLRDSALIAFAGPASNVLIAVLCSVLIHIPAFAQSALLATILAPIIIINISLAIFNLVPVYPLDGSKILLAILPAGPSIEYEDIMRKYGSMILLLLILPIANGRSPISFVISPVISLVSGLLLGS